MEVGFLYSNYLSYFRIQAISQLAINKLSYIKINDDYVFQSDLIQIG